MAFRVYLRQPNANQVALLLSHAQRCAGRAPKSIITDHGVQFQEIYRAWCHARGVRARYGAIQKSNSLAVIERCIRSIKTECLRRIFLPLNLGFVERELAVYFRWYHLHRPHQGLGGGVPADRWPGAEPLQGDRTRRRAGSRRPKKKRKRHRVEVEIIPFEGRRHLPVVQLRRAA